MSQRSQHNVDPELVGTVAPHPMHQIRVETIGSDPQMDMAHPECRRLGNHPGQSFEIPATLPQRVDSGPRRNQETVALDEW